MLWRLVKPNAVFPAHVNVTDPHPTDFTGTHGCPPLNLHHRCHCRQQVRQCARHDILRDIFARCRLGGSGASQSQRWNVLESIRRDWGDQLLCNAPSKHLLANVLTVAVPMGILICPGSVLLIAHSATHRA